ncbi:hypothetical protein FLONG3_7794 [Fusarium longipes]|uniref:Uncharacterized protein n=1 Tax=Fusarium longipes TaxID=694270 RepID=A0A395SAI5_9HYPO|nr:hypothetical protein FLONG3_7794 [Fusarium longipes]
MASNTVSPHSSPDEWTEAEKTELLGYHVHCLAQLNSCIENAEKLYQQDMMQEAGEKGDCQSEDGHTDCDDLAREAFEQVSLMAGYLDLLEFIESEMEACGLSILSSHWDVSVGNGE